MGSWGISARCDQLRDSHHECKEQGSKGLHSKYYDAIPRWNHHERTLKGEKDVTLGTQGGKCFVFYNIIDCNTVVQRLEGVTFSGENSKFEQWDIFIEN